LLAFLAVAFVGGAGSDLLKPKQTLRDDGRRDVDGLARIMFALSENHLHKIDRVCARQDVLDALFRGGQIVMLRS
jgi:hypothetical protein